MVINGEQPKMATHLRLQLEVVQADVTVFAMVGYGQNVDHVWKALIISSLVDAIDHFLER